MFKLITLNVNGIAERHKRDTIFDFLRNYNADIIFLQETHNDCKRTEEAWAREWGGG